MGENRSLNVELLKEKAPNLDIQLFLRSVVNWIKDLVKENHYGPELGKEGKVNFLRVGLLGFAAILAIVIGASLPSSPFSLKQPGAWYFGIPLAVPSNGQPLIPVVLTYGGMLLLMRVWYELIRSSLRRPSLPLKPLAWIFVLWVIPLLIVPPLFSRDVYSYAAQGDMVTHNISPYIFGPGVLAGSPYVRGVDPLWLNAPAPYGPLFLFIAAAFTNITMHHVLANIVLLRLLELAGVILVAIFLPRLAVTEGGNPGTAFVLGVLNPVTLLHLIAGAHNDAFMLGLLIAGLALAKEGRPFLGIVMCSLAAAIKIPAAAGVFFIGWQWMGVGGSIKEKIRPVVTSGIIFLAVMAFLSKVTSLGWGWVFALSTPGTVRSYVAPATAVGLIGGSISHFIGLGISTSSILTVTRLLGFLLSAAIGAWMLLNSDRIGFSKALGLTFLAVVVLAPVVQPWYLSWALILLATVATPKVRKLIVWLSIFASFLGLPGGQILLDQLDHISPLSILLAIGVLVAIPATPLPERFRQLLNSNRQPSNF